MIEELRLAVRALGDLRQSDLRLIHDKHEVLLSKIEGMERGIAQLPTKSEIKVDLTDLQQRVQQIQSMEASLRELSMQTIKTSFQSEATIIEQKISLGSQQRYYSLEKQITELSSGLDGKIREQVLRGIFWGLSAFGAITSAAVFLVSKFGG